MTFVSFHSGHVVMMLFLKLQILCKAGYCSTFVCVSKAYNLNFFLLQLFGYIGHKDTRSSIQKLMNFRYKKNQTKWPIELWTLKQEMETDDDDATIRERFSLVQSILFIDFTDILPAHFQEEMVESCGETMQFGLVSLITDSGGNSWCPWLYILRAYHPDNLCSSKSDVRLRFLSWYDLKKLRWPSWTQHSDCCAFGNV